MTLTGDFGDSERSQLLLQLVQLFHQLFLLFPAQFMSFHFGHFSLMSSARFDNREKFYLQLKRKSTNEKHDEGKEM